MLRRILFAGALAAVVGPALGAAPATAATPVVSVSPHTASPGGLVLVSGSGFTPGQLVRLQICGNNAARGSIDCNQESSELLPPTPDGTFSIALPAVAPPMPCPCVVEASTSGLLRDITIPIAISGVPTAPVRLPQIPVPALKVVQAKVTGRGPVLSWFGAPPRRTLAVTVQNTSNAPLDVPPLLLTRGRGSQPTTIAGTVQGRRLNPGEIRTWDVPLTFDAFSIGRYTVLGRFSTLGTTANFRTRTAMFPLALLFVALVAVHLVLVWGRDRARRRLVPEAPRRQDLEVVVPTPVGPATPGTPNRSHHWLERAALAWSRVDLVGGRQGAVSNGSATETTLEAALKPFRDLEQVDALQYWALVNTTRRPTYGTTTNGAHTPARRGSNGRTAINGHTDARRRTSRGSATTKADNNKTTVSR